MVRANHTRWESRSERDKGTQVGDTHNHLCHYHNPLGYTYGRTHPVNPKEYECQTITVPIQPDEARAGSPPQSGYSPMPLQQLAAASAAPYSHLSQVRPPQSAPSLKMFSRECRRGNSTAGSSWSHMTPAWTPGRPMFWPVRGTDCGGPSSTAIPGVYSSRGRPPGRTV